MKVKRFAKDLTSLKEELQDKAVLIKAENGLLFNARIKLVKKDAGCLDATKENVDYILISY